MANIVIVPWPEFGHVNPTLKLAKALAMAGHRVCYLGISDFKQYVCSQGLEFRPILESTYPAGHASEQAGKSKLDRIHALLHEAGQGRPFDLLKETQKEVQQVLGEIRPDLLITDVILSHLADMVAYEFGTQTALLNTMVIESNFYTSTVYPRTNPPTLILCPREFDFPNVPIKSNTYYIEPCIDLRREEINAFPWERVDETKPLIYCSLGSVSYMYKSAHRFFQAIIEAVGQMPDRQMVLSLGPHLDVTEFHPVPENVVAVNWAPQIEILKRASMMITHGGLGTVKECIYFGVPMIVFPAKYDQPHNAARITFHGLGLQANISTVTAAEIGSLIDRVGQNPSFRSRCDSMSKTFREIESSERGIKIIEELLRSQSAQAGRIALEPSGDRSSALSRPAR